VIPVLPYTAEVLDALLGRYNLATWPLSLLAPPLAVLALALTLRPTPRGGRAVAGLLAAAWAWVGIGFQIRTAGQIDFMAPVYGGFFVAQAAALAWVGVRNWPSRTGARDDPAARLGATLAVFAIVGYPVVAVLTGRSWPELPIVGLAPDPTAMLTLGLLLVARPVCAYLLAVPALWSLVAGMTALSLGTPERLVLPIAAAVVLASTLLIRRGVKP